MPKLFKSAAVAALLAAASPGIAVAQGYSSCPPGYTLVGGVCQVTTGAVGAAGAIAGGAVGAAGAITGGALNATGNVVGGTVCAVTGAPQPPAPACPYGYTYYNGACYPAR